MLPSQPWAHGARYARAPVFPSSISLLLSPVSGHASIFHLSSSCLQPSELACTHLALKVVKNMGGSVNMQVCCLHGAPHQAPGKHGEIRLIFLCASRCLSSRGHPGVFSVLRRICLSRRMRLPSVRVCSDAAEHIHTKGTRVLLLWNKLTQTFFPQDCLGLPSNPTALCSADARLGWIFPIFNLFSGWVLLCNRRLSSKIRRGSPSKQVGPGRWGRTHRSSEGPQHLFSEALVSSCRPVVKVGWHLGTLCPYPSHVPQVASALQKQLRYQAEWREKCVRRGHGTLSCLDLPLTFPVHVGGDKA